ncbi:MAG: DUF2953 domain-containing protein [Eubacterium sp.]|nr:DUF2953 domain-containing protein [Eubacterium sp.]
MSVVLTILKITGIVILCILGLLLVILACLLFVPIRYQAELKAPEEGPKTYAVRVSWLLRFFAFEKRMNEEDFFIRIGFIRLKAKNKEKKKEEEAGEEKPQEKKSSGKKSLEKKSEDKDGDQGTKKKKKAKKGFSLKSLSDIMNIIQDDNDKRAIGLILQEIKRLIVKLLPRKLACHFIIGTGDPCSTGYLFGAFSIVPPVYGPKVNLYPDFERRQLTGYGKVAGGLQLIYLVLVVLRLYRDESIQRAYRKFMKKKKV